MNWTSLARSTPPENFRWISNWTPDPAASKLTRHNLKIPRPSNDPKLKSLGLTAFMTRKNSTISTGIQKRVQATLRQAKISNTPRPKDNTQKEPTNELHTDVMDATHQCKKDAKLLHKPALRMLTRLSILQRCERLAGWWIQRLQTRGFIDHSASHQNITRAFGKIHKFGWAWSSRWTQPTNFTGNSWSRLTTVLWEEKTGKLHETIEMNWIFLSQKRLHFLKNTNIPQSRSSSCLRFFCVVRIPHLYFISNSNLHWLHLLIR